MLVLYLFMLDLFFFFFNDTATTEIYTLSLHDALPISGAGRARDALGHRIARSPRRPGDGAVGRQGGRVSGSRLDLPTGRADAGHGMVRRYRSERRVATHGRSEERRVGKEGRSRGSPDH